MTRSSGGLSPDGMKTSKPRHSFELEEEFDFAKLGFDVPIEKEDEEGLPNSLVEVKRDRPPSPTTQDRERATHTSPLRPRIGGYDSADWVPTRQTKRDEEQPALEPKHPNRVGEENDGLAEGEKGENGHGHSSEVRAIDFQALDEKTAAGQVSDDQPASPASSGLVDDIQSPAIGMEKTNSVISTATGSTVSRTIDDTDVASTSTKRSATPMITRDYVIRATYARIPGTRRLRPSFRLIRTAPAPHSPSSGSALGSRGQGLLPNEAAPHSVTTVESEPEPPTPFQRAIQSRFTKSDLSQIHNLAKSDNTLGSHLPSVLRDFFPALADPSLTVGMANALRRELGLEELSLRCDKVALRRAVAQMRAALYIEIACALVLPGAPSPKPKSADETTDDEDQHGNGVPQISLTPSNIEQLAKLLPVWYPAEKALLKNYLSQGNEVALGEKEGKVVWEFGVGRVIGGKGDGVGFKGKVGGGSEGLVQVFVDHSNILHGLLHHFHSVNSPSLPPRHLRTLSLPALSLLLRRGRPTPPGTLHLVASSPLAQNLDPLVRLGWEVSILKRVEIYSDEVVDSDAVKLVPKAGVSGSLGPAAGSSSGLRNGVGAAGVGAGGGGGGGTGLRRYKEQGVDELLHLKLLQALNSKSTPAPKGSTIVLATGDARGGQFNREGFVGGVREALKRGWAVELWSFSAGLSRAWAEVAKRERWDSKFQIRVLDDWAEWLMEVAPEMG